MHRQKIVKMKKIPKFSDLSVGKLAFQHSPVPEWIPKMGFLLSASLTDTLSSLRQFMHKVSRILC